MPAISDTATTSEATAGGKATISRRIAAFVHALSWDRVPEPVRDRVRDRLLDAFSTAVYCRNVDDAKMACAAVSGDPAGPCTSLVDGATRTADNAAFVNGVATSSIFFDDFGPISSDHPGCMMVPTALACAEQAAAAGARRTVGDLLTAVLAGYEVQLALGDVAATAVIDAGFRTTSVFGTVATSATAGRVLGLDEAQLSAALDIGANLAFGVCETRSIGTAEGYLQPGLANRAGIMSAKLGLAGARTAARTFEGPAGYLHAFGALDRAGRFLIEDQWRVMSVWTKPYPLSGGKLHSVGNALAALDDGVRAQDIAHVTAELKSSSVNYSGGAMNRKPPYESFNSAQISIQFCLGAALAGFDMTSIETFRQHYGDPGIARVAELIDVVGFDDGRVENLTIELRDGSARRYQVDWDQIVVPSVAKMTAKLKRLSAGFWSERVVDQIAGIVTGPPDRPIGDLSELLRTRVAGQP